MSLNINKVTLSPELKPIKYFFSKKISQIDLVRKKLQNN